MVVLAILAAVSGCYLLFTSIAFQRRTIVTRRLSATKRLSATDWLAQAGMVDVRPLEFALVEAGVFVCIFVVVWAIFGGVVPAFLAGLFGCSAPVAVYRSRRARLRDAARDGWPNILEEIRLRTGAVGRSVPVAVFEAGASAPTAPMRAAFARAQREWMLSTDFSRATLVLKRQLADATADVVCETLLVAHEIGGNDIERRLSALIDDRRTDLRHRQEARSRQAGVRFARWFVLIVPFGMALVGLGIGDGRAAYQSPGGQLAVAIGIVMTGGCWIWASRIMRLPDEPRVFES